MKGTAWLEIRFSSVIVTSRDISPSTPFQLFEQRQKKNNSRPEKGCMIPLYVCILYWKNADSKFHETKLMKVANLKCRSPLLRSGKFERSILTSSDVYDLIRVNGMVWYENIFHSDLAQTSSDISTLAHPFFQLIEQEHQNKIPNWEPLKKGCMKLQRRLGSSYLHYPKFLDYFSSNQFRFIFHDELREGLGSYRSAKLLSIIIRWVPCSFLWNCYISAIIFQYVFKIKF